MAELAYYFAVAQVLSSVVLLVFLTLQLRQQQALGIFFVLPVALLTVHRLFDDGQILLVAADFGCLLTYQIHQKQVVEVGAFVQKKIY